MKYITWLLWVAIGAFLMLNLFGIVHAHPSEKDICKQHIEFGMYQKFDLECKDVDWSMEEWLEIENIDKLNQQKRRQYNGRIHY